MSNDIEKDTFIGIFILVIIILLVFLQVFGRSESVSSPYNFSDLFVGEYVPPYAPTTYVLGILVGEELYRIIDCESDFDPEAKNPKSTAYGLCQFLDGTWEYVQKKWNVDLDRDSIEDQLYACERLLREEGIVHWKPVWECIGYNEE